MDARLNGFRYSVAIRTLGLAGDKYQQELISIKNQTIKPEKVIVYLAEGYEPPKETIGLEEIVYVKKGMVAQRALEYREIDSPFILLLDDDVFLEKDSVEKLALGLIDCGGDCIAADTFKNHEMSFASKLRAIITNWAIPFYSKKWSIKIHFTGSFFYNNNPNKDVYLAQSAAGPCSLWTKQALLRIHFDDEVWLDNLGFSYGDDLLFFYKLYINGGRLLFHYNSGVVHLDSRSSRASYNSDSERLRKRARAWFLLWWRIGFDRDGRSCPRRILSLFEFIIKFIYSIMIHLLVSIVSLSYKPLSNYILGNIDAIKFINSEQYRKVPNFKVCKSLSGNTARSF